MSINISIPYNILHKIYDWSLSGRLDFIYRKKEKNKFFFSSWKFWDLDFFSFSFSIVFSIYILFMMKLVFFSTPRIYLNFELYFICIWEKLKFTSDWARIGDDGSWAMNFRCRAIDIKCYYLNNKRKYIGIFEKKGFAIIKSRI